MWSLTATTTTHGNLAFSRQQVCGHKRVNFLLLFGLRDSAELSPERAPVGIHFLDAIFGEKCAAR
jgi:hypothetical protein